MELLLLPPGADTLPLLPAVDEYPPCDADCDDEFAPSDPADDPDAAPISTSFDWLVLPPTELPLVLVLLLKLLALPPPVPLLPPLLLLDDFDDLELLSRLLLYLSFSFEVLLEPPLPPVPPDEPELLLLELPLLLTLLVAPEPPIPLLLLLTRRSSIPPLPGILEIPDEVDEPVVDSEDNADIDEEPDIPDPLPEPAPPAVCTEDDEDEDSDGFELDPLELFDALEDFRCLEDDDEEEEEVDDEPPMFGSPDSRLLDLSPLLELLLPPAPLPLPLPVPLEPAVLVLECG